MNDREERARGREREKEESTRCTIASWKKKGNDFVEISQINVVLCISLVKQNGNHFIIIFKESIVS